MLLTLPSNCSKELYPKNVTSDYQVQLPHTIQLTEGQYEVGLTGFHYPRSWFNFTTTASYVAVFGMADTEEGASPKCYDTTPDGEIVNDDAEGGRVGRSLYRRRRVVIPPGHYVEIAQILDILNDVGKAKSGATFIYREERQRVSLHFRPGLKTCKYTVRLKAPLVEKLGWPREDILITEGANTVIEAPGVIKLDSIDLLFVHCDIAADSHVVGDVVNPLMRVIPVMGKHGAIVSYEPLRVDWLPVRWNEFRTLRVLITDAFGEKIPFERGNCSVKLVIRRRSPF
jgi:hypothetical protein